MNLKYKIDATKFTMLPIKPIVHDHPTKTMGTEREKRN